MIINNKSADFIKWAKWVYSNNQHIYLEFAAHKVKEHDYPYYDICRKRNPTEQKMLIDYLYREGFFVLKIIEMSYSEFEAIILNKTKNKIVRDWFYRDHGCDFRQALGFVKNFAEIKNSPDYDKINWRKYKGIERDKAKSGSGRSRFRAGKNFAKKHSNRSYRSHIRKLMNNEEWDKIESISSVLFFDPWDWD